MAVFKTTDSSNVKQAWHKSISTLAQEDTPFISAIGEDKTTNPITSFFNDSLRSANADNAGIEGAAFPDANLTGPVMRTNYTQIFRETAEVSRTLRESETLGTSDAFSYQIDKVARALKLDLEKAAIGGQASVAPTGAVAGRMAGAEAMITTNVSHGTNGSTPGYNGATYGKTVTGTLRALTEDMFNAGLQGAAEKGGKPTKIFVGGSLKRKISAFTGNSTRYQDLSEKKINNVVDVYTGDFGVYQIIPNFYMSTSVVLAIDPKKWSLAYLTPWTKEDLAKTVDGDRKAILCEVTLKALDERANVKIADVQ
jgi:hypothetical protein